MGSQELGMGVVLLCTWWSTMLSLLAILLLSVGCCHGGLLGAGTGDGSCRAAPYRAASVQWAGGCPAHASCCSEYGYCRTKEEWLAGGFRDCNGQSNGSPLAQDAVAAEEAAAAAGDRNGLPLLSVSAGAPPVGTIIGEVAVGTGGGAVGVAVGSSASGGEAVTGETSGGDGSIGFESTYFKGGAALGSGSVGVRGSSVLAGVSSFVPTSGYLFPSGTVSLLQTGVSKVVGDAVRPGVLGYAGHITQGVQPASTQVLTYGRGRVCYSGDGYYYC